MTTANQAFRQAANSPAGRHASEAAKEARESVKSTAEAAKSTAESVVDDVSEFASDAARKRAILPQTSRAAPASNMPVRAMWRARLTTRCTSARSRTRISRSASPSPSASCSAPC